MNAPSEPRRMGRSIVAVIVGFVTVVVLSLGTDVAVFLAAGKTPFQAPMSDPQFALAVVYRSLYAALGSFVAARMAPSRPMRHALILGGVGLLAGAAGLAKFWDNPEMGPRWYAVAVAATPLPLAWVGGRLSLAGRGCATSS